MERSVKKAVPSVPVSESNLVAYVDSLAEVVREIRRVLNRDVGELAEVSADYTVLESDWVLVVSGSVTLTFPSAYRVARPIVVYNSAASTITVAPQTGETVDGGASDTVGAGDAAVTYFANGSDWIKISAF